MFNYPFLVCELTKTTPRIIPTNMNTKKKKTVASDLSILISDLPISRTKLELWMNWTSVKFSLLRHWSIKTAAHVEW